MKIKFEDYVNTDIDFELKQKICLLHICFIACEFYFDFYDTHEEKFIKNFEKLVNSYVDLVKNEIELDIMVPIFYFIKKVEFDFKNGNKESESLILDSLFDLFFSVIDIKNIRFFKRNPSENLKNRYFDIKDDPILLNLNLICNELDDLSLDRALPLLDESLLSGGG